MKFAVIKHAVTARRGRNDKLSQRTRRPGPAAIQIPGTNAAAIKNVASRNDIAVASSRPTYKGVPDEVCNTARRRKRAAHPNSTEYMASVMMDTSITSPMLTDGKSDTNNAKTRGSPSKAAVRYTAIASSELTEICRRTRATFQPSPNRYWKTAMSAGYPGVRKSDTGMAASASNSDPVGTFPERI